MDTRKVIFLDRDGVINKMMPGDYVRTWEQFEFLPGAIEGLKLLSEHGYEIHVVTNQAGVGKGLMSEDDLLVIHSNMKSALQKRGIGLSGIYYCPHRKEDDCDCRKPKPGMLRRAAREHRIDLSKTLFIGDSASDAEAGRAAGCEVFLMEPNGNLNHIAQAVLRDSGL